MITSSKDIEYFSELADTLNFSRAAERLGITQPSLSIAIKRLETDIGTLLFHRHKNGVVLTRAGIQLCAHAKKMRYLWHQIKTEALSSTTLTQGCITIGCHSSVALTMLHRFLPELMRQYPNIEIKLEHDLSRKMLEKVVNYALDIAIVVNPVKHPDLVIKKLYIDNVSVWHSHPKTTLALKENPVIICDPDLLQTQKILARLKKKGLTQHRMLTSQSLEVVAKLTAHGAGFGILPQNIAKNEGKGLLHLIENSPSLHDEICLVYRNEARTNKLNQVVIHAIASSSNF